MLLLRRPTLSSRFTTFFDELLSPDIKLVHEVIVTSQVTKLGGQVLGCLAELADKPLELKREMCRIYDNTSGHIWSGLHGICHRRC